MRGRWSASGLALGLLGVLLALAGACAGIERRPIPAAWVGVTPRVPVVFVSGMTGTQLRDPDDGEWVWGRSRQLFGPRDGGYRIALPLALPSDPAVRARRPQADYEPVGPILALEILGWTKTIYRPLVQRFEAVGYRRGELTAPRAGDTFFFFDYDWRYGNLRAVRRLDRQLEGLRRTLAAPAIDLVCQSNAAKICRWLAKYGTLDLEGAAGVVGGPARGYRIRKLVLVGASNNGALRVLRLLDRGRAYVPLVGRKFQPEVFFTLRPLFEDLPSDRDDLFFDERGETLAVDLFDARTWERFGWSIFDPAATRRVARRARPELYGDPAGWIDYLQTQLDLSRRLQKLLARDAPGFDGIDYYLLENRSEVTIDRALLTQESGSWTTYFLGDRRLMRDAVLRRLAGAPGDGHAVLDSQRGLSPQERAALKDSALATGGHFDAVVQPAALDSILGFLAERSSGDAVESRSLQSPAE